KTRGAVVVSTARRIARHHAGEVDDRSAVAKPGTGVHYRRVGKRQGASRANDPSGRTAERAAFRPGELWRDSREPDGKRVLWLQERRLYRRRRRPRRIFPGREQRDPVPGRSRGP